MILATELRIGNLVSNTLGETKVVNTEILVYLLNDKNNEFEPVEVTIDLLLSFGFSISVSKDSGCGHATTRDFSLWIDNGEIIYWKAVGSIIIKYAHQLQNLYYWSTLKELKTLDKK